jgi:hypothetical protein
MMWPTRHGLPARTCTPSPPAALTAFAKPALPRPSRGWFREVRMGQVRAAHRAAAAPGFRDIGQAARTANVSRKRARAGAPSDPPRPTAVPPEGAVSPAAGFRDVGQAACAAGVSRKRARAGAPSDRPRHRQPSPRRVPCRSPPSVFATRGQESTRRPRCTASPGGPPGVRGSAGAQPSASAPTQADSVLRGQLCPRLRRHYER